MTDSDCGNAIQANLRHDGENEWESKADKR